MNKNFIKHTVVVLITLTLLAACKKSPGEGGKSSIKGKIKVEDWNGAFTIKNGEYAGADEDVYIVYGNHVGYDDRTRTDYNGEFEFRYLRKGKYKIFVYSEDKTLQSQSGNVAVVKEVELSGKKEATTLEQLVIYK
jgi:hypothetical protein